MCKYDQRAKPAKKVGTSHSKHWGYVKISNIKYQIPRKANRVAEFWPYYCEYINWTLEAIPTLHTSLYEEVRNRCDLWNKCEVNLMFFTSLAKETLWSNRECVLSNWRESLFQEEEDEGAALQIFVTVSSTAREGCSGWAFSGNPHRIQQNILMQRTCSYDIPCSCKYQQSTYLNASICITCIISLLFSDCLIPLPVEQCPSFVK